MLCLVFFFALLFQVGHDEQCLLCCGGGLFFVFWRCSLTAAKKAQVRARNPGTGTPGSPGFTPLVCLPLPAPCP